MRHAFDFELESLDQWEIKYYRVDKTTFVIKQEEPYELRGSRTVLWERRGETPLRNSTVRHVLLKLSDKKPPT